MKPNIPQMIEAPMLGFAASCSAPIYILITVRVNKMLHTNQLELAAQKLLLPASLVERELEQILSYALGKHIDAADIYLQSMQQEHWSLEDSQVKAGSFSIDKGFGLRVISGEKTGFAYADEISTKALEDAVQSARSIVQAGQSAVVKLVSAHNPPAFYPHINPLDTLSAAEKIDLLHKVDRLARAKDPRVREVMASLSASYEVVLVLNSDGTTAADIRPLVHFSVQVVVEQNGRREAGSAGSGARGSYT
ncbi:MAG TPA: DNA gyrase modulator, partial [Coxiellaceae bacterium]|nr:DNA gyrase modulator [Coxiellaceae bacterium]